MDTFAAMLGAYLLLIFTVVIAVYIVQGLAVMKCLRLLGHPNPWMAWIPFANYYALAEATCVDEVEIIRDKYIPMSYFKLWWVAALVCGFIPAVGMIASMVITVLCYGWNLGVIYAYLDGTTVAEKRVLGYVSTFIGIISIVIFLGAREERVAFPKDLN